MTDRWLDTSQHPLHALVFPPHYTYEELDEQMNYMRDEYRRFVRERPHDLCVIVVDVSRVERSEPRNRKRIIEGIGELTGLMETRLVAQAYVTDRTLIRAALTAVSWLYTPPWPVQVFARRAEADHWLHERLEEAQRGGTRRRRSG